MPSPTSLTLCPHNCQTRMKPRRVRRASSKSWSSRAGLLALCSLLPVGGGCSSDLFSDDTRINELLARGNAQIGGGSSAPDHPFDQPQSLNLRDPALNRKSVPTKNPAARELTYQPSDEARDVGERLARFQAAPTENALSITLSDALKQAQRTGRENINRQEEYILAAIRLLTERHLWEPRFANEGSVSFDSVQTDGDSETALRILNELRVTQRLPYGGEVAARWVWDATENLRSAATGQYVQSSGLILQGNIPLLRGAGMVAQEGLIQAERELIYSARNYEEFRRAYLVEIANDFFSLLLQQAAIRNAEEQLKSVEEVEKKERALFDAGRKQQLEVNNAANRALSARSDVADLRDRYILSLDRFKVRLGLPIETVVVIVPSSLDLPEPDISLEEATGLALDYRLDLQNERDRVDDSRRRVRNAKNELLPDLNLAGDVTFPTDADAREGGAVYEPDDVRYGASLTFGLPLDRENERLALRASTIGLQKAIRDFDEFRDSVIIEVRRSVRAIELARFNLTLAEQRVQISERRVYETELKRDEIDTQQKLDALNDLLGAQNARDQALTDLRNSVLNYLLATGQLRVDREGDIQRLPGMEK